MVANNKSPPALPTTKSTSCSIFAIPRPKDYYDENEHELLRMCDYYNIPFATNIAMAEVLVCALDRGDLDWRELSIHARITTGRKSGRY